MRNATIAAKERKLRSLLADYGTVAIAYSGGVDSTLLAAVAFEVLGHGATMVLADSPSLPREELAEARAVAESRGWQLVVIRTAEFSDEAFLKNDGRRCYFCKSELFRRMDAYVREQGIRYLAYGEIADDQLDPSRLGAQAAREHAVVAPLAEAGLSKDEIRALSRERNLPTSEKASFACLASRFPLGTRIRPEEMLQVERAEQLLREHGFTQYRARHHGDLCRIEVELEDLARLVQPGVRERIVDGLREVGYRHVTVDLAGYRCGSTAEAVQV